MNNNCQFHFKMLMLFWIIWAGSCDDNNSSIDYALTFKDPYGFMHVRTHGNLWEEAEFNNDDKIFTLNNSGPTLVADPTGINTLLAYSDQEAVFNYLHGLNGRTWDGANQAIQTVEIPQSSTSAAYGWQNHWFFAYRQNNRVVIKALSLQRFSGQGRRGFISLDFAPQYPSNSQVVDRPALVNRKGTYLLVWRRNNHELLISTGTLNCNYPRIAWNDPIVFTESPAGYGNSLGQFAVAYDEDNFYLALQYHRLPDPDQGGDVLLAVDAYVYRSSDGVNWSLLSTTPPGFQLEPSGQNALGLAANNPNDILFIGINRHGDRFSKIKARQYTGNQWNNLDPEDIFGTLPRMDSDFDLISLGNVSNGYSNCPGNRSASLALKSSVRATLDLSTVMAGTHTVSFRFMPQYESSYEGPIISFSNDYFISMAGYGEMKEEAIKWRVRGGNAELISIPDPVRWPSLSGITNGRIPETPPAKWRHFALSIDTNNNVNAYLDGQLICGPCQFSAGTSVVNGVIQLGQRPLNNNSRRSQFFGFIDDVAVFDRDLTALEISRLAERPRLLGTELNLIAGFDFDEHNANTPRSLQNAFSLQGNAAVVSTSLHRENGFDHKLLPKPITQSHPQLPFLPGQIWEVVQGYNRYRDDRDIGSHNGFAAFCYDFRYVPPATVTGRYFGDSQPTYQQTVTATAPGQVVNIDRASADAGNGFRISIDHGPNEYSGYLHLDTVRMPYVNINEDVIAGDSLAPADATGLENPENHHLHFSLNDREDNSNGNLVTIPAAFYNYWASDNFGENWYFVRQGIPKTGQWVQRCDPVNQYNRCVAR